MKKNSFSSLYKLCLIIAFLCSFTTTYMNAQQDTLFLNDLLHYSTQESFQTKYAIIPHQYKNMPMQGVKVYNKDNHLHTHTIDFQRIDEGKYHGYYTQYDSTGRVQIYGKYDQDKKDSIWSTYDNGSLYSLEHYKAGLLHGTQTYYYPNGSLRRKSEYKKGDWVKGDCWDTNGVLIPYFPPIVLPLSGDEELVLRNLLVKNLKYPSKAVDYGKEGEVYISFAIDILGNICDIKAQNDPGFGMMEEALRVIKLLPRVKPGKKEGKITKMTMMQAITFKL